MLKAYCIWCFAFTEHELYRSTHLARTAYRCAGCRNLTVRCRYCPNMAAGPPDPDIRDRATESPFRRLRMDWHKELCAEHDGTIASFESLAETLDDLEAYEALFRPKRTNLLRVGKIAAGSVGGVVVLAPAIFLAVPSIAAGLGAAGALGAASTGTAIVTLSGAALTSASLAAIGGGTVAGGVVLLTAAGASLGAALGGVVSNAYFGKIQDFSVRKYNEGKGPAVIIINGFLTQKTDDPRDWKPALRRRFLNSPWYHVNWEAKTRASLGSLLLRDASGAVARRLAINLAKRATRKAAGRFNPVSWAAFLADILSNPWHVAMVKASMTGILLADLIARTRNQEFILMGHSLGARVVYYILQALSTKPNPLVQDAYLLGGAVGVGDQDDWLTVANAVKGCIHNCYTKRDLILTHLYRGANLTSTPIGIRPIEGNSPKVRNWDFSDLVDGHNAWKRVLPDVLTRICAADARTA